MQCDACFKWRRLLGVDRAPLFWHCTNNLEIRYSNCEAEQELTDIEIDARIASLDDTPVSDTEIDAEVVPLDTKPALVAGATGSCNRRGHQIGCQCHWLSAGVKRQNRLSANKSEQSGQKRTQAKTRQLSSAGFGMSKHQNACNRHGHKASCRCHVGNKSVDGELQWLGMSDMAQETTQAVAVQQHQHSEVGTPVVPVDDPSCRHTHAELSDVCKARGQSRKGNKEVLLERLAQLNNKIAAVPTEAPHYWIQCDSCDKWRKLTNGNVTIPEGQQWYCKDNDDAQHNHCQADEEESDSQAKTLSGAAMEEIDIAECHSERNPTGYKGVTKIGNKFHARLSIGGKLHWLGTYDTPEQAAQAVATRRLAASNPGYSVPVANRSTAANQQPPANQQCHEAQPRQLTIDVVNFLGANKAMINFLEAPPEVEPLEKLPNAAVATEVARSRTGADSTSCRPSTACLGQFKPEDATDHLTAFVNQPLTGNATNNVRLIHIALVI